MERTELSKLAGDLLTYLKQGGSRLDLMVEAPPPQPPSQLPKVAQEQKPESKRSAAPPRTEAVAPLPLSRPVPPPREMAREEVKQELELPQIEAAETPLPPRPQWELVPPEAPPHALPLTLLLEQLAPQVQKALPRLTLRSQAQPPAEVLLLSRDGAHELKLSQDLARAIHTRLAPVLLLRASALLRPEMAKSVMAHSWKLVLGPEELAPRFAKERFLPLGHLETYSIEAKRALWKLLSSKLPPSSPT